MLIVRVVQTLTLFAVAFFAAIWGDSRMGDSTFLYGISGGAFVAATSRLFDILDGRNERNDRKRRQKQQLWRDYFAEQEKAYQAVRGTASGDVLQLREAEARVLALQTKLLVELHFLEPKGITETIHRHKPQP